MSMTQAVRTQFGGLAGDPRVLAVRTGLVATALAVGVVLFGTYVNNSDSSQKSGGPALVGIAVAVGLVVFGLLVPRAIRAARGVEDNGQRWPIGLTIASVLSLAAFWTGAPVVLGAAAALAGSALPEVSRARRVTLGIGVAVAALTIVWTILSTTVMS